MERHRHADQADPDRHEAEAAGGDRAEFQAVHAIASLEGEPWAGESRRARNLAPGA